MIKKTYAIAAMGVFLAGCSTTGPRSTVTPPPFECTSIHPEVCELEKQFHMLRFEQADQIAAIDAAERKRKRGHSAFSAEKSSDNGDILPFSQKSRMSP